MGKKRDNVTYDLKDGRRVVYRGTTRDPVAREAQHRADGKRFTKLLVTSGKMTKEGAKVKEMQTLNAYRQHHRGRNPKYNKDTDG